MSASQNHEVAAATQPGVWVWDHDRRRIVWANENALRFWGERSVLDLIDRDFSPADPTTEQFARLLHAATRSGTERVRTRLTLTPKGRPERVAASAARFALSDGRIGLRISAVSLPVGLDSEPERMREIFATAPLAMALFAEDGGLLVQNDAAGLIFGNEELASLSARYGERGMARDALRALLVSGSFSHVATLRTRAGTRRHRVTMRRMLDPVTGAFAALASFADTVEREDAVMLTTAMERGAEQALLSSVEAGVAVYDDALKPLYMSDRARDLLGVRVDSATPQLGRLFPRDRERITAALLDIRDGRAKMASIELAVRDRDGSARWVQLRMRKGGWRGASAWIATIIDVTEGQRAAIAVQRATDDRDTALEAIGVGVVILRADGGVAEMNATAADLLGREPGDERPLREAFDRAGGATFDGVFAEEVRNSGFEIVLQESGSRLMVGVSPKDRFNRNYRVVTLRPVENGAQAKPGIFERREAVARASHELRTPLNAILGFTQLMLAEPDPIRSEAYVGYLQDINDSGAYMLRLLQDLLDMRRVEADALRLDSSPIDLGNLLRVIAREAEFAARKRDVELVLSIDPSLPPVLADLHTLRQALTNIVGNAVKFTSASGWVRISALQRASGAVEVEVIDNGQGMTAEELAVALEPFGQMTNSQQNFGGAGMGVPLAKGFIEANHARFELTSEKGLGTIGRVVFPPDRVAAPEG